MSVASWIEAHAARAPAPERARQALAQLSASWPATVAPIEAVVAGEFGAALARLLAVSPISVQKVTDDPAALLWLAQADVSRTDRGPRRLLADYERLRLAADAPDAFDHHFRALRRWKSRELLRIALREVAGWSSIEASTLELTAVAELCLRTVTEGWLGELARKWGRPLTGFVVLGMGKLGGEELNYSSDIDVIFLYGEDGQMQSRFSHREFFTRLAEKIVAAFSSSDPSGALFRIDLRLRPEGAAGPLVRSLESMEHYYAAFGETWERMALSKARVVAGSEGADELGYEFAQRLQAFIYPRSLTLDVVDEIRALKARIEREVVGLADLHRDVKLGYGGIREIEFVTQTLQLLHGAQHAFLQQRSTLKALRNLRELDLIPHDDTEALLAAYRFLRTVEHRLQIEQEAQTHTLPDQADARAQLAASLGFATTADFDAALHAHTARVRAIFDSVLGGAASLAPPPERELGGFRDPARARRALDDLGGGGSSARFSPRTKQLFHRLEPSLLGRLGGVADPDAALIAFVRFVERYGSRGLLYETLLGNPRVLEALVRLFDASRFLSEIAIRQPQLIEELARGRGLGTEFTLSDHLAGLACSEEGRTWPEWVRVYRRSQLLRLGLRDVLGFATLRELQAEHSALAEACLRVTLEKLGLTGTLTIIALGKFGGRELGYGADLDVTFIGEDARIAGELLRAMTEITAEGIVFPVDARLRPEGEAGPLVCSLASYEAYFEKRAQFWEAQALTKARPIAGPESAAFEQMAQRFWRRFGARPNAREEIAAMHARVVRERGSGDELLDFKTGRGGLMQVEFFVQGRQMEMGLWETNTIAAIDALAVCGALDPDAAAQLGERYLFLRRVESVLRRVDDQSVSRLPRDEREQRALALRCGFATREDFLTAYRAAREELEWRAAL